MASIVTSFTNRYCYVVNIDFIVEKHTPTGHNIVNRNGPVMTKRSFFNIKMFLETHEQIQMSFLVGRSMTCYSSIGPVFSGHEFYNARKYNLSAFRSMDKDLTSNKCKH